MRQLRARPLPVDKVAQAFALVQAVRPDLTLEAWRAFATPRAGACNGTGGILILENEQDCIVGLFSYRVDEDLRHGATLVVDTFIALDIVDPEKVIRALAAAMERQAEHVGCRAIHVSIPEHRPNCGGRMVRLLLEQGHHVESLSLCKPLPAPRSARPGRGSRSELF